ncbi:MAG TPA: WYL domain-containing protein, partial [Candidatus Methylomirabilis sp.]|nr:WYL domain-containing protein [Candidatus Methylomirabilis sp.]
MPRSERLIKLLTLLQSHPGIQASALARACAISERTLQRDLDALTAAGFPVYFDHGYRLTSVALLLPVTLRVDEALALRLAAQSAAPRAGSVTARSLTLAAEKLQQALTTRPPEGPPEPQLALELPVQDSRTEALLATLTTAIAERRSVKLTYSRAMRRGTSSRRVDPYLLLPVGMQWDLLAYCHDRQRILRIPVNRIGEVSVTRQRFRPVASRLLERHLHPGKVPAPAFHKVRVAYRSPLSETLKKHPPVGALMWEEGPEGSRIFTLLVARTRDLVPWLLSCGEAAEV